jgi:hypothetical protein
MPGIAISVLMFVVVAAVIGVCLTIGAPWLAIPIVFLVLVVWGGARLASAREGHSPGIGDEDVSGERIEFTEEDRRTLTPASAKPGARGGGDRPEPAA